jgi:hypothetical protein
MPLTPEERQLNGRVGAHIRWANAADRSAETRPARDAFMARFERAVDPRGILPAAERAKRAEHAKRAYFLKLALKSAQARRGARDERSESAA